MNGIAVQPGTAETEAAAAGIAHQLGIPLLSQGQKSPEFSLLLEVGNEGLRIIPADRSLGKELCIDFVNGPTAFRRVAAGSKRQPLARAVGLSQGCLAVVDATAGLGRDAFLMACLGCHVTAVERSPIIAMLLGDALSRARNSARPGLGDILERMRVLQGESTTFLAGLAEKERPDVVYLDPMYVASRSTALSKKEMRILRMLVGGDDEDACGLFRIARQVARRRVVVKRHALAPAMAEGVDIRFLGRSVRYDVYLSGPQIRNPTVVTK